MVKCFIANKMIERITQSTLECFFFTSLVSFFYIRYMYIHLFHSSRGLVRYLAQGDVSTNYGHRHGCGKVVRKEVHR